MSISAFTCELGVGIFIGVGIFAFAHSYMGAQNLYDFEVDRNDQEDNKAQRG
jgi:predicted RNA methylase